MKLAGIFTAIVLSMTPTLVLAAGCAGGHSAQTSSCQTGTTWDADKGSCVADTNV